MYRRRKEFEGEDMTRNAQYRVLGPFRNLTNLKEFHCIIIGQI